jgi:hypothetical protein
MKLTAKRIPERFVRGIPRGFRLVNKEGHDFLLVESLFCPKGHSLVVDSVRIHGEPSIKLKVEISRQAGFLFVDAFWGSHAKLFSFIPRLAGGPAYVEACCPYCGASIAERWPCPQAGCGSDRSLLLMLPGGKNKIHVCARLGCPGHELDITDMPERLVHTISGINYFGAGADDLFGGF